MAFAVEWAPSAVRAFRALPRDVQRRIATKVDALALDPSPPGAERIAGADGLSRVRVGDYRIVYAVDGGRLVVVGVRVGHRREVYRDIALKP